MLYPLFVHDIGALLYHPTNQTRTTSTTTAAMAVAERRNQQRSIGLINGQQASPPSSLQQSPSHQQATQHQSHPQHPSGAVPGQVGQPPHSLTPHSLTPHSGSGRPSIDRAHTFPTPPTSASSIMGMSSSGNSYEWGPASVSSMPGNQPLSIDTGLSNARSVPTTPATTPPGSGMHHNMQYQTSQGYDNSRQLYTAPPTQSHYAPQPSLSRYGQPLQPSPYIKSEMAPPNRGAEADQQPAEAKLPEPLLAQAPEHIPHASGEEPEHEHESEYAHHNGGQYSHDRGSYAYNGNGPAASLHAEHGLPNDLNASPSHHNASGRGTPRTSVTSQTQWSGGYGAPQRPPQSTSSNLYSVMVDSRAPATNGNGNGATDSYSSAGTLPSLYPSYAATNGASSSNKRGREDDDEADPYGRPSSRGANGDDIEGVKRRKTVREGSVGGGAVGSPYDIDGNRQPSRTRSAVTQRRR